MKLLKGNRGYIYVASNKAMPGLVKIGMTTKNPRDRLNDLYTTGVPVPFNLIYQQKVKDPRHAERILHQKLARYRVTKKREFFEIDARSAVALTGRTLMSLQTVERSWRWIRWLSVAGMTAAVLLLLQTAGVLNELSQWRSYLAR